ncbi:MAG: FAD-dependent oxidoreductase [Spirochaetaceae bacterium]
MKYVIVGGVAGGAAVAARLRRNDEHAQIIIFEKGEYISYANCGLPYYVGETIKDREKLFLENPASFKKNLNIDVKNLHEVLSIDKENRSVKVHNLHNSDILSESYDKLILSPGATPIVPPIEGIDSDKVFTLRNVPDADKLKAEIDDNKPTSAVVVGAGFIGMEAAENLYERGLNVSIVEMADQVMVPLDFEMAAQVHEHLKFKEVALYLSDGVKKLKDLGNRIEIELQSGKKLYTDIVVLSIGVKPLTILAENAGIEVNRGIVVNDLMETSAKDIYALGDAAEIKHGITGIKSIVPLAGPAGKQARILADNLVYNTSKKYKGAIGTSIAKIFDLTVATTGLPEKMIENGAKSVIINGSSHAGYYPGAMQLFLKLVFDNTGKLLGAQGVGYDGVDKRIEMIAAVIRMGGTVNDLTEVEHAYAPPYSSSKDPVNILGFTAENVLLGRSDHTTWKELKNIVDFKINEYTILDIRTVDERELHPISGTINLDKSLIRENLDQIPKNKSIVILCSGGLRAYLSERILKQEGFNNVSILSGGLNIYFSAIKDQTNQIEFSNTLPHRDVGESVNDLIGGFIDVDACGLQCPGPILKLKKEIELISSGEKLRVTASDPGFYKDVTSWCNMTGNKILGVEQSKGQVVALIEKSSKVENHQHGFTVNNSGNEVTIICFSDDMDKALASLVIATGAIASGKKVTIFFTFWGLSIIKETKKQKVKKNFLGKIFGFILPKNLNKLGLSKMNMGGLGSLMMKGIMRDIKVDSLQTMLNTVVEHNTKLIACQMSMDVMGVKEEELIDAVEIGGVANYLEAATSAGINLFV